MGPHSGPGRESLDITVKGILTFAISLVAVAVVVHLALGLLMHGYAVRERKELATRPELMKDQTGQFPVPRLQRAPAAELAEVRNEEESAIESYGWVDRKARVARIPIGRAMDLLAKKGLPTRNARQADGRKP
jgi:hypothetical protein